MHQVSNTMRFVFFIIFSFVASVEGDSDLAIDEMTTATDLNYGVETYDCDMRGHALSEENEYTKKIGAAYRVCFEPNAVAKEAGVGIKNIDSWTWETSTTDGWVTSQVLKEGKVVNHMGQIQCQDDGKCILDSMLNTNFFKNPGSVEGTGTASFTAGTGSVPVKHALFPVRFKIEFDESEGEMAELLEKAKLHNDAYERENSAEEVKDEL